MDLLDTIRQQELILTVQLSSDHLEQVLDLEVKVGGQLIFILGIENWNLADEFLHDSAYDYLLELIHALSKF